MELTRESTIADFAREHADQWLLGHWRTSRWNQVAAVAERCACGAPAVQVRWVKAPGRGDRRTWETRVYGQVVARARQVFEMPLGAPVVTGDETDTTWRLEWAEAGA